VSRNLYILSTVRDKNAHPRVRHLPRKAEIE
jgi:hypothetical protein